MVHYAVTYLIYAAVLGRAATWYITEPPVDVLVMGLLAAFGILLVSENLLTRRLRWYPWVYLALQSCLSMAVLLVEPELDYLVALFMPLSFQAVLLFKWRTGFLWIVAFYLAMFFPLMTGFNWNLSGLAMSVGYAGVFFLMGGYAHLIDRAQAARQENQRLLEELQEAHRRLQDYAGQVKEFAALQERSHLVRELHDSVTQTLFSMNLAVQAACVQAGQGPGLVSAHLDRLQELAKNAVAEIQLLVRDARPRPLAGEGLAAALGRLASERQQRDGLDIRLEVVGCTREKGLPQQVAPGLYRIAQEALNNVAKHAGSGEAVIRLDLESRPAFLEVQDHGCGFDSSKLPGRQYHMGLAGMAERARELGWRLEIASQPGRGTRVRIEEVIQ